MLENGELSIAVADVSCKGVSAALFMSRAITLLHMYAGLGLSPAKAMEAFNNTLAQHSPNKLFITAFVARYQPETKTLTYTNAGHNPPYMIFDELITLDKAHGMAAGVFSDIPYEEAEITPKDDDALFVFTDGVNEAENKKGAFFTTQALENVLRRFSADPVAVFRTEIIQQPAFWGTTACNAVEVKPSSRLEPDIKNVSLLFSFFDFRSC